MQACGCSAVGCRSVGAPKGLALVPGYSAIYLCNEGAGQVLTDYSGNGYHGQLGSTTGADTNDPAWGPTGLTFGGDDRVICPTEVDGPATGLTVQCVASTTATGAYQNAVGKTASGPTGAGYAIQKMSTTPGVWRLYAYAADGARKIAEVAGHTDGTWGIVTGVVNGTTATVYAGTTPGTPVACVGHSPAPALALTIGALPDGSFALANGAGVAAVVVYPVALSAQQLAQNAAYFRDLLIRRGGVPSW